jgi:Bax protein
MQVRDRLFVGIIVSALIVGFYLVRDSGDDSNDEGVFASFTKALIGEKKRSYELPAMNDWGNHKFNAAVVPEKMTVKEKKARFKGLLGPVVDKVYLELYVQYMDIKEALEKGTHSKKIIALKEEYKAETDEELLAALKPHPRSIVLAQAAMESAWGTSRFFLEAKNAFGIWSYDSSEPRIAAGEQRDGTTIWLKKYKSIYASVKDNYRVLARGDGFQEFRQLRLVTDNPYELVKTLDRYSEKGSAYGKSLASMIRFNKFASYDDVFYEPK